MSIESGPHVTASSKDLAKWIELQGNATWWNVDGDPLLTDEVVFPCPGDELSEAFRRVNRMILIQDPHKRSSSKGQLIQVSQLDEFTDLLGNNVQFGRDKPIWAEDRFFYCCWKDTDNDWLLLEDRETRESSESDEEESEVNQ